MTCLSEWAAHDHIVANHEAALQLVLTGMASYGIKSDVGVMSTC